MKKLISLILLLSTTTIFADTDDNEIIITQTGDTLKLYIDQEGFGNKIGGNDFSSSSTAMLITGATLEFDLDFTGDSNVIDWTVGSTGSSDDSDINFSVTGSSNTFDLDQGSAFSAERLNADLIVIGSSNVFDIDWESDDVVWNWDITGASNNINTLQKDGANEMTVELNGDSADVDINQLSGTCAASGGGCATPNAIITLDITSDNSTIQINQKDSANDS